MTKIGQYFWWRRSGGAKTYGEKCLRNIGDNIRFPEISL